MKEKENLVEKNVEEKQEVEANKYPHDSLQKVEDERLKFWGSYRIHNTLKLVILVLSLGIVLFAWVAIPKLITGNAQAGISFAITVAGLGATYAYTVYVRKKFDRKMKVYFDLYFRSVNEYVYEDKVFSDVELLTPGKITLDEFNECKLYKDVVESGSRGLTTFKCKGIEASIVDCAGNIKAEKRIKPVFVGKMVRSKASYEGEKPVFVYLKGNERALPPTGIDEVKNVFEDQKMVVRSDYKDWKKVLNGSVMKALEGVKVDKILVDVAFAIYSGRVYIMMGYDDPLMVLPLQTEFDPKPTEIYKKDMAAIAKVLEALNK